MLSGRKRKLLLLFPLSDRFFIPSPKRGGVKTNYKMYGPTQLEYGSLQVGCSDSKFLLPWKVPIFSLSKRKTLNQKWIRKTYLYDATHFLCKDSVTEFIRIYKTLCLNRLYYKMFSLFARNLFIG